MGKKRNFQFQILMIALAFSAQGSIPDASAVIEGEWSSPCLANDDSGSMKTQLHFFNEGLEVTSLFYSDSECKDAEFSVVENTALKPKQESENIYSLRADSQSITQVYHVLFHSSQVADYNEIQACELKDWELRTPKSVLGTSCFQENDFKVTSDTVMTVSSDQKQLIMKSCLRTEGREAEDEEPTPAPACTEYRYIKLK